MERYYRILGIPDNSSKETVKKAYYTKMKALHPDKVHGTVFEDTATFFSIEITEAYNKIMAKYKEDASSSINKNQASFIEEDIYVEKKGYLRYTLSNNINTIINEIYNRVRCTLPDNASQIPWNINSALSPNVKKAMNTHNYDYSMTSYFEGSTEYVVINKRVNDNWYISGYEISSQQKITSPETQKHNKNNSKENKTFGIFIKIVIAVIIFGIIIIHFNNQQTHGNQPQANHTSPAQVFANVISCDWLNVRNSPSSINDKNIIETIREKTKVEIIENANNGWVRIKYGNSKIGYVHSNYLSK